jgi:glutamate racemase
MPLLERGVDTLVLGCTHYPFLRATIAAVAGPRVAIVDTGPAVARQVERVVAQRSLSAGQGHARLWTTGDPVQATTAARQLLDEVVVIEAADGV